MPSPPEGRRASPRATAGGSAFAAAGQFIAECAGRVAAISAALLAPCFWHRRIEAGDLASHLYNAWLVQLIEQGKAPGLWIAHQSYNVLFDLLLTGLGSAFGLAAAERIAVSLSVLIFFWGSFAFVAAATRRAPWFLVPLLAMIAFGWTFEMGFFNYYLSLGLSFFGLAIAVGGTGAERFSGLLLAPLIWMGNPFGLAWMMGVAAYVWLAGALRAGYQALLLLAAGAAIVLVQRDYLRTPLRPLDATFNSLGLDQFWLFGRSYLLPMAGLVAFVAVALLIDYLGRPASHGYWSQFWIPLQIYLIVQLGVDLVPEAIHSPTAGWLGFFPERFTLLSVVVLCWFLGLLRPGAWQLAALCVIAACFFGLLYRDTGMLNQTEARIEQTVRTLPAGSRVLAALAAPPGSRVYIAHMLDRACVGYCFSYADYETFGAFRTRATAGNRFATTDWNLVVLAYDGTQATPPPGVILLRAYQCGPTAMDWCLQAPTPGEVSPAR